MVSYEDAYNINSDNIEPLCGSQSTYSELHACKHIRLLPMTPIYVVVSYIIHIGLSGILFYLIQLITDNKIIRLLVSTYFIRLLPMTPINVVYFLKNNKHVKSENVRLQRRVGENNIHFYTCMMIRNSYHRQLMEQQGLSRITVNTDYQYYRDVISIQYNHTFDTNKSK